ncbi:AMP-binding enzyme domain-containing protein [Sarocladium implicatum]|nr:AMP-binding enzyme domain-containing protein [Sarocladium implicatum]
MAPGAKAYAGSPPPSYPQVNVFDFIFSEPFDQGKDHNYTLASQRIGRVDNHRALFVDHITDRTVRNGALKAHSLAFASGLHSLGLSPNDLVRLPPTPSCAHPEIAPIVLIQLPNCLAFLTALLGTLAAGLTATLVSPALTSKEIGWILKNSRPRVIITASSTFHTMRTAIDELEDKELFESIPIFQVDVANSEYPEKLEPTSRTDWTQLLTPRNEPMQKPTSFNAKARTAVILWSSGSSGKSKGVLLSHSGLIFGTLSYWNSADFYQQQKQQQRWLGLVPFYHIFGLMTICLPAICTGSTVYTMSTFKLVPMLDAIRRRRITFLHIAPPIGVMLAKSPLVERYAERGINGKNGFSSVCGAMSGGAPLGHDIITQVYKRLGFRIKMAYGLTEVTGATFQQGMTASDMHRHGGDSGQPLWGVEIMVTAEEQTPSAEQVIPSAIGTAGEILIRSPGNMLGYLPVGGLVAGAKVDMAVTYKAVTQDRWFRTGDVGMIDAEGCLRITDRIKDLIKVRGYQVAPAELEALLCGSNDVADAGVVAIYDQSEATERPRAFVVPAGGTAGKSEKVLHEIAQKVKKLVEQHTARYKWLQGGLVFVDAIPKSPSGKILRRVMKDGGVKGVEVALYEPRRRNAKL